MGSCRSTGLHWLLRGVPWLFIKCPDGNRHWFWKRRCMCCVGSNGQGEYRYRRGRWEEVDRG